ncbi:hypothetical protein KI387_009906, partial [Taxus chinensis]
MTARLLDIAFFPKFLGLPFNKLPSTNPQRSCQFLNINSNCPRKTLQISSKHLENSKSIICRAAKDVKSRKPSSEKLSSSGAAGEGTVGFSQGRDEDADRLVCPGCGVFMQDKDPHAPGFFRRPLQNATSETLEVEEEDIDFFDNEEDHLNFDEAEDEELRNAMDGFEPARPEYDKFMEGDIETKDDFSEEDEDLSEFVDEEDLDEYQEEWRNNPKGKGFREETLELKSSKGRKNKTMAKEAALENLEKEQAQVNEDDDFFEEEEDDDDIFGEEDEGEEGGSWNEDDIDWDLSDSPSMENEENEWKRKLQLDAFAPAGPGFGNVTDETLKARALKREKKKKARAERKKREEEEDMVVVCARCHCLRHYGDVKNQRTDNLLPEFDFESAIGNRLMKWSGIGRTVVVMVVDVVDFDGSFPRRAAKVLSDALRKSRGLRLIMVVTKADLLPGQISPARLDRWVRIRARAAGAPKLSGVFMVSAHKDIGVRNLIAHFKDLAGPRGNVWVIGAQNAGKSTLINAIGKKDGRKVTHLTEAAVPGTTLGIIRIGGILPAKAKLYDTPGLLHPYQMTMRLNREEQKMIEIRKQLKPRTYRVKVGQAVHIGGLIRLDVDQASVETIYVTVWASVHVSMHLGKVETANEIKEKHFGIRLQ